MSFSETTCQLSTDPADLKVIGSYNADTGMICFTKPRKPDVVLCRTPESLVQDGILIACKDGMYNGTKFGRLCVWGNNNKVLDDCKSLESWK